jgi:hypothetical protein
VHFGIDDLEELVYFFMKAHFDRPFSKEVLINTLCKINQVPEGNSSVRNDVEKWIAKQPKRDI